jgi:CRP-like cAMP-binding protein
VLDGGPRTATVIADTPVRTIAIAAWNLRTVLKNNPTLTLKMLEEICRRTRNSTPSSQND